MKIFRCIIDDGKDVFKTYLAAKNKKDLLSKYAGNGDFEKITDETKEYFTFESVNKLRDSLTHTGWSKPETELICALLEDHIAQREKKHKPKESEKESESE